MCGRWRLALTLALCLASLGALPRLALAQSEDTPAQLSSVQSEGQVAGEVSLDLNSDIASYANRITGAWSTDLDAAAMAALFTDQQRWRRHLPTSSSRPRRGTPLSTLDCQPTFVVSASRRPWPWLTTETTTLALCFSVCMDHPSCTSTVPLIRRPVATPAPGGAPAAPSQQPSSSSRSSSSSMAEYHLLLRCGLTAMWRGTRGSPDSSQADAELGPDAPAEIRGLSAGGKSKPICRNVVDAAVGQPGVRVHEVGVPPVVVPDQAPGVTIKGYTRVTDRQYDEELILPGHDLWSHWRLQPLLFVQGPLQAADPSIGSQAMVLPLGAFPGLYQPAEILFAQAASRGTVVTRSQPRVLTGAWVPGPNAQGGMQATYVVQRPDMGDRWYAFATVRRGAGPTSTWSLFADGVNGPCPQVVLELWRSAAAWNASQLASQTDIPRACVLPERYTASLKDWAAPALEGGVWGDSGRPWQPPAYLNFTTRVYSAAERLAAAKHQGLLCPLLMQQQLHEGRFNETLFIRGCNNDPDNAMLVYADAWRKAHCRGQRLITTPAVELRYGAGHLADTYHAAWAAWSLFRELPEGVQTNFLVGEEQPRQPEGVGTTPGEDGQQQPEEYYTTVNAALQYNITDLDRILQQQLARAVEGVVGARPRAGSAALSSGDVVNAFTVLVLAYLNVFKAWPPVTKRHAVIVLDVLLSRWPHIANKRWVQVAWLGFSRAVAMAIVAGVPLYGFFTVVHRREGRVMAGDSPRIIYIPVMGQPPCSSPARNPAAVVVTSTMWYDEKVEWALVGAVMGAVVLTIVIILLGYVVRVMRRKSAVTFPFPRERHLWGMVEKAGARTARALCWKERQAPAPAAAAAAPAPGPTAPAAPPAGAAVAAITATAMLLLSMTQAAQGPGRQGASSSNNSHGSGVEPLPPGKGPVACRRRDASVSARKDQSNPAGSHNV